LSEPRISNMKRQIEARLREEARLEEDVKALKKALRESAV